HVDPYLTGTVTTFSSNAPIGDSAPTGSTYATGVLQQAGNVAIHPEPSPNHLYPVDASRSYQPAATILEATNVQRRKPAGRGGTGIVTDDIKQHFTRNGTTLIENDREALLNYNGNEKVWALFGSRALPYNIDRNPEKVPSIAEMTEKAIELLSKNENGFFLMV